MYDVAIIGGSFAGLAAAYQLGRARKRVAIIDAGVRRNRGVVIERRPVVAVIGDAPALSAVVLADGARVPIEAAVVAPKLRLSSPLPEQLGCALEPGPLGDFVKVDAFQKTSVPGVFAAGDAATFMHSVTFAAAAGALAGVAAHQSLVFGL